MEHKFLSVGIALATTHLAIYKIQQAAKTSVVGQDQKDNEDVMVIKAANK